MCFGRSLLLAFFDNLEVWFGLYEGFNRRSHLARSGEAVEQPHMAPTCTGQYDLTKVGFFRVAVITRGKRFWLSKIDRSPDLSMQICVALSCTFALGRYSETLVSISFPVSLAAIQQQAYFDPSHPDISIIPVNLSLQPHQTSNRLSAMPLRIFYYDLRGGQDELAPQTRDFHTDPAVMNFLDAGGFNREYVQPKELRAHWDDDFVPMRVDVVQRLLGDLPSLLSLKLCRGWWH